MICLGYGYNIFNLGAIFASFIHSDSICFTDNIAQLPLKLSDTTGAVARSVALSFYQNVSIAAPSLLPPANTSGTSRYFRSAGILTLLSAAIQWWTFILASMVNLDALSLLNQMPSQSRVTLRAGTCLAGLQVGHTWWIAHVLIGGAVPI